MCLYMCVYMNVYIEYVCTCVGAYVCVPLRVWCMGASFHVSVCVCSAGGMPMFVAWLQSQRETNNEVNRSELESLLLHRLAHISFDGGETPQIQRSKG